MKTRGWSRGGLAVLFALGAFALAANGCGAPEPGAGTPDLSTASTGDVPTVTAIRRTATAGGGSIEIGQAGESGSWGNPVPLGREARVGDWEVMVMGATLDATQAVLDENMFNDPPAEGSQYVLVSLAAVYVGEESSTFWIDMLYGFVGGGGDTFDSGTAVASDSLFDDGEVFAGGAITGNLVFMVASDQVPGGTLMVEEAFAWDEGPVFFAVD